MNKIYLENNHKITIAIYLDNKKYVIVHASNI